jgi:putative sigma-54 modulation protein
MDIAVRGRNVDVPQSLRAVVEEKVTRLARFLGGIDRADVRFSEERNPRIAEREVCEVTMYGHGRIVRARAAAADTAAAVDRVIAKLEHRMEKLKGKRIGRSHPRRHGSLDSGTDRSEPDLEGPDDAEDAEGDGQAKIVKTKAFDIKPMTPEEAALQMRLLGHDFFLFTNVETARAAVVYRRSDGNVGLIDAAG